VQDKVHRQMHQTVLADAMMDLWSVVRADLNIADMIRPAEGFGPHNTVPVDFGCIVAGKDPVSVDATICRMVGLASTRCPISTRHGPGAGQLCRGCHRDQGQDDQRGLQTALAALPGGFDQWPEYNIKSEGACSSCQGLLAFTIEKLKALGEYDKNKGMTIIVGPKREIPQGIPKEDLLLFGDCTKKWRDKGVSAGAARRANRTRCARSRTGRIPTSASAMSGRRRPKGGDRGIRRLCQEEGSGGSGSD